MIMGPFIKKLVVKLFPNKRLIPFYVVGVILLSRLIFIKVPGMSGDIWWLSTWAKDIVELPFKLFYTESHARVDIPPLLPIIFGSFELLRRLIQKLFDFTVSNSLFLKSIFIFFECMIGLMGFRFFNRQSTKSAIIFLVLFVFGVAFIYDSAIWAQSESIVAFFLLLAAILLMRKNFLFFIFLTFAVLSKPQALIAVPFFGIFSTRIFGIKKTIGATLLSFLIIFLIMSPFLGPNPYDWFQRFAVIFSEYPVTSANGWNFWVWTVGAWVPDSFTFFGLSCKLIGMLLFGLGYLILFWVSLKATSEKIKEKMFWIIFVVFFLFFTFPTAVHERYYYYGLIFLLFYAASSRKIFDILLYIFLTVVFYFNIQNVLGHILIPFFPDPKIVGLLITLTCTFSMAMTIFYLISMRPKTVAISAVKI